MFIIATISKNSYPKEKVKEILLAGADVLRYNFSHGTPEEMKQKIAIGREAIAELDLEGTTKILADLPGGKIRLGMIDERERLINIGDTFLFKSGSHSKTPDEYIPIDYPRVGSLAKKGNVAIIADGEIAFEILEIKDENSFTARALTSYHIPVLKGINFGSAIDELDHFTPLTHAHIAELAKVRPDMIAFSFARDGAYLRDAKKLLRDNGIDTRRVDVVSKVESPKGLQNIDSIVEESDIIMVARGDLGLTTPIERLGLEQKNIIARAKKGGKRAVVATQILNSLLTSFVPSRAEILDLTNIVLDGADGIMLAKETGLSLTPGHSVAVARRIIDAVQKESYTRADYDSYSTGARHGC